MTVDEALASTTARLAAAGVDTPRVDAEILLSHVIGLPRSELTLERDRALPEAELEVLDQLVARRKQREPLAYVVGEWGFRRLTLQVDARVLVPRPETEVVVERCLERLSSTTDPRVLDVGTGSGAIALALADELPGSRVTGIDVSAAALEVARANAERCGLAMELREWDLFAALPAGPWDLVVSNPPYVRPAEIDTLEPEVREWEPREALVGEGATDAVARGAHDVLRPGAALVLEIAEGTAGDVAGLFDTLGYGDIAVTRDLTGRERVVDGVRAT